MRPRRSISASLSSSSPLSTTCHLCNVRLQATVIHGHDDVDDFIVVGHEKESFNMVAELIVLEVVSMTQK